jgi:ABC-type transporter Mla MlaB component
VSEATLAKDAAGNTALSGDLGFAEIPAMLKRADAISREMTVDLSGLQRVDSAGLSFLIELKRRARARKAELRFVGAPERLCQLADFFEVGTLLGFRSSAPQTTPTPKLS